MPYTFKSAVTLNPDRVAIPAARLTVGGIYEVDRARGVTVVDTPVVAVWNGAVFLRCARRPALPVQPCSADLVGGWARLQIGTIAPGINAGDLDAIGMIVWDIESADEQLHADLYALVK